MSVHNTEHNSPLNSDHDDDIHDSVNRISKLDISDPLHFHPNDNTALTVVSIKLNGTENYQVWSCAMLLALEGKNKIDFIDGSCKRSNTDEVLGKRWDRMNKWLLLSLSSKTIKLEKCTGQYGRKIVNSGANQHMTYTDKELNNVIDISHLKIKVGHPNGTEAYISKIRNLRLSNGLTLYDVMVIPEYCVTLIFVHKLVKENKVIVAFDENRCYFLNQDLNLKLVLGIGEQCEGLYYYSDKDPVLNVLKNSLNFDKIDNTVDFGNDADSSNDFVATQNEEVATFEENVFSEASKYSHWIDAMNPKMNALLRNGTWELVELPEGRKSIGSIWIYKIKFRSSGEIDTKQRLVAQGFGKKEGIDYEKTFSPVVKMVTIRRGCLYETTRRIYPSNNKVRRLKKSLYGLKQAFRQWNAKLISTLIENRFSQSKFDYSLYTKSDKEVFLTLLVYVKILLFTGNSVSEIEKFKVFLKSKFMIKDLGKLQYFLGIEVVDTDKGLGVYITKTSGMFLTAYSDADWAKCIVTRKSVTAIQIAVNLVFHERAKHLEIDLHFVREKVLKGLVKIVKVDSANQITDILTKGLDIV
nr:ribonuclease H-like domain-containing protein [Tanacetum cinerariifolium]